VMTFAKISAGTGYLYLVRHTALGDAEPAGERDAASYYAAQGNPPGRWTGRGAPLLGLADIQPPAKWSASGHICQFCTGFRGPASARKIRKCG
jgi:hypothetical protein